MADLTADAITAIAHLAQDADHNGELVREVQLQNGQTFTFRNEATESGRELGEIVEPPKPDVLHVTTLTGFADALTALKWPATDYVVHVEDYGTVSMKPKSIDLWGNRHTYVIAKYAPVDAFSFAMYYSDLAKFIIQLQVAFYQTDQLLYLIKIASNLKAGTTVDSKDSGLSQTITVRTGEVTTADVNVPPRIKLIPIRTFPEAAPVESEFLIRFQQTANQAPSIALFDLEGKKWQGELMQSIKRWLSANIDPSLAIIA